MKEKKAFLSGLGIMGKRHLVGLLRAGFHVYGFDPKLQSHEEAKKHLETTQYREKLDSSFFHPVSSIPTDSFDVAVFSETAPYRFSNLTQFLFHSEAERFLLEKPLTADPLALSQFSSLFCKHKISTEKVFVNLSRRNWSFIQEIKKLTLEEKQGVTFTLNGGAIGLGCNGIHHFDVFLFVTGMAKWEVSFAELSVEKIPSGRGAEFFDFGGEFRIKAGGHSFFASVTAQSSTAPILVVKGENWIATLDESDLQYQIRKRRLDSQKPKYLCGHDYVLEQKGCLTLSSMEELSFAWAQGEPNLPTLEEGVRAHHLLFAVLEKGNAKPPYSFT